MLKIKLNMTLQEYYCFWITDGMSEHYTSFGISNLFNMNIDEFNKIVINEVIKHSNYLIVDKKDEFFDKDLIFNLEDDEGEEVLLERYMERFKETFAPQLMLIKIGGFENDRSWVNSIFFKQFQNSNWW